LLPLKPLTGEDKEFLSAQMVAEDRGFQKASTERKFANAENGFVDPGSIPLHLRLAALKEIFPEN
jgi:hypothetical protein